MLRLRGQIPRETKWDIVVDLFFYREPEEAEKEEQAAKEPVVHKPELPEPADLEGWNPAEPAQWSDEPAPAVAPALPTTTPAYGNADDWANEVPGDWANSAAAPPAQPNWGASNAEWH